MNCTIIDIVEFYEKYPEYVGQIEVKTRFGYKKIEAAAKTAINSEVYTVKSNNNSISGSPDHLLMVNDKWTKIKNINIGDKILLDTGYSPVDLINKESYLEDLYDIQVEKYNEFIANGFVSHNSTILEAISFVLFNKSFRKANKPQLINSINQKDLLVEIWFTISGSNYYVRRGMKPNIFEIYKNDKLIDQNASPKDYQDILENQILKINHKSFSQIVVLGTANYTPFMLLPAAGRREIIEDLLDIQIFSKMNNILKIKIQENKSSIITVQNDIEILSKQIEINERYLKQIKENSEDIINDKTIKIEELQSQILKNNIIIESIHDLQENIQQLEYKRKEINSRLDKLTTLHKSLTIKKNSISTDITFYSNNDTCPKCQQNIENHFKCSTLDSLKLELDKSLTTLEEISESWKSIKNELLNIDNELFELSKKTDKLKELETFNKTTNNYINDLQQEILSLKSKTKNMIKENEDRQRLTDSKFEKLKLEKEVIEYRELYAMAALMLKDDGIKTKIIKQYIPIINKLVNKYLNALDLFIIFNLDENFNESIKSRYRDIYSYECLPANSEIETEDGIKTIKHIVDTNYKGKVLSINEDTGKFVWNEVINAWSTKNKDKKWVQIKIDGKMRGTKKHLICTHDHKILTIKDIFNPQLEYVKAENSMSLYSTRIEGYRDNRLFNTDQLSIIIGMMLGDSNINKEGQLTTIHKRDHKQYIELKQQILGGTVNDISCITFGKLRQFSKLRIDVNAQTKKLYELMYQDEYGNKIKKTTKNIINYITEKSLAFWYMDDGSMKWSKHNIKNGYNPSIELCTDNFTYNDCKLLTELLYSKWGITSLIYNFKNKYFRIKFNVDNTKKFMELISPYIIDCMQYKLHPNYRNNFKFDFDVNKLEYCASKIIGLKYLEYNKNNLFTKKYSSRLYDMEVKNNHNFIANKTIVHNSFSEGEKSRINLALLFTWREIAKLRNNSSTNLLILDEVFDSSLDANGADELIKILLTLTKDTNTFVISHRDSMHDKFENIIKFAKVKNFSRILEKG